MAGNTDDGAWWILGVCLALLAAMAAGLGDNLIKLSFTIEKRAVDKGLALPKPIFCRPLWLTGMLCLVVVNSGLVLAAYSFADSSLLIPFAGLNIVFNLIFANRINKEYIPRKVVINSFVILLGVLIVVCSANHDSQDYTKSEIEALFGEPGFIGFSVFIMFLLTTLMALSFSAKRKIVKCVATGLAAGTFGAITQLFAKVISETVKLGIEDDEEVFTNEMLYVGILFAVLCGVSQLMLLNMALSKYKASMVSPFVTAAVILIGSLYSCVFFQEYKRYSHVSVVMLPIGILVTAAGVGLLALSNDVESTPMSYSESEKSISKESEAHRAHLESIDLV